MNDQDLERELRSQRSPREDGYAPTRLPMTLEDGMPSAPRRSMVPRVALFAGAALAGALAVAVVTGILSGPGPDVGSDGSPSAQPTASVPGDCGPRDVAFSAEPWGGAAGSRGTVVTISLAGDRPECLLPSAVVGKVMDADWNVLVSSVVAGAGGRSVLLAPGAVYTIGVAWSNWCGEPPAPPVILSLKAEGWSAFAQVSVPDGGTDPVPPCMGGSTPSSLSVTIPQPAS
jgi:hypothetical protein